VAVAMQAIGEGLAPPLERAAVARRIAETQWEPAYA
jgi:hypothetical protein